MTDERRQAEGEEVPFPSEEQPRRDEIPFDEDPPIDPSVPQVGNSKARFVTPEPEPEAAEGPGQEAPRGEGSA